MSQPEICVICQETPGESFVNLGCCKKKCCVTCFVQWMRVGNTCPMCRHEHAPKPEKPRNIQPVEQPVRPTITREVLKKAVHKCWDNDLHLLKGFNDREKKIAIDLAKIMASRVANVANGFE